MKQILRDIIKGKIMLNAAMAAALVHSCAKNPEHPFSNQTPQEYAQAHRQHTQQNTSIKTSPNTSPNTSKKLFPYGHGTLKPFGTPIVGIDKAVGRSLDSAFLSTVLYQSMIPKGMPSTFLYSPAEYRKEIIDKYISNRFRVIKQTIWASKKNPAYIDYIRVYQLGDGRAYLSVTLRDYTTKRANYISFYLQGSEAFALSDNRMESALFDGRLDFDKYDNVIHKIQDSKHPNGLYTSFELKGSKLKLKLFYKYDTYGLKKYTNQNSTMMGFIAWYTEPADKKLFEKRIEAVPVTWSVDGHTYRLDISKGLDIIGLILPYEIPPKELRIVANTNYNGKHIEDKIILPQKRIFLIVMLPQWIEALDVSRMTKKDKESYLIRHMKNAIETNNTQGIVRYSQMILQNKMKIPHSFHFIYGKAAYQLDRFDIAKKELQLYVSKPNKTSLNYRTQASTMLSRLH